MNEFMSDAVQPPLRHLRLGYVAPVVSILLTMIVLGITLARGNQSQLTSGLAPDFTITTFDGDQFRLSDQRGKVVIINFWASWCVPCRAEAPALQAVWERYRDQDVVVVGIAYLDIDKDSLAFMKEFGLTYPNGLDLGTKISEMYRMQGVPETFVVDKNGNIAQFFYGGVTDEQLNTLVVNLLQVLIPEN